MNEKDISFKERIKEEYKKCAIDPVYFLRKYCYIQHPTKGRMLFNLYGFQEKTLLEFIEYNYNIVLKGRQIGLSTLTACYSLWLMLFHLDKNVLIIATQLTAAKNLISKVKFAFNNLPPWLRSECIEDNKTSLKFKNGSNIRASPATDDAGRSDALSLLIIDEAAHIDNANKIWLAAYGTLSTGGKAIIISTPNGVGNFFHKTWIDAESGENEFNKIKLDWKVHPERTIEWRKLQDKNYGERHAAQEHDAEFIGSGNTVIDSHLIESFKVEYQQDPVYKMGFDNNIWIWKNVDYSRQYILSADPARGDGQDFSAFHIIDAVSCEQVAEYRGQVDTTDFGNILISMASMYNDALLIIDNSNIGWDTIQTIIKRGYKNLFYMTKDLKYIDPEINQIDSLYKDQKKAVPGFTISMRTRPLIISKLQQYMLDRSVIIRSKRTLEELEVFIWLNGKAQAMDGYNDDLVMSLALSLWIRDTALLLHQEAQQMTLASLSGIRRESSNLPNRALLPGQADPYSFAIGRPNVHSGGDQSFNLRELL